MTNPPRKSPPRPDNSKKGFSGFADQVSSAMKKVFVRRKRQPNFFFSMGVTVLKLLLILVLVVGVSGIGVVIGVARAYYETIPELEIENIAVQNLSSFVYDRNGVLLTTYKGTENRIWAAYDEIPQNLKDAFVAVEDARFYTHDGVDIKRIVGAFVNNMRNDSVQGGSTITQQLVKTRLLSTEQTYKRKIQEAYIAIEMEKVYDKEQILEWYLNTIPLGASNYGVKAAAKDYFGKELDELTLRECAALAGITRNPTKYNPRRCYYTKDTPQVFTDRTEYALFCMYENNFITREEYIQAQGRLPDLKERYENGFISQDTYHASLRQEMPVVEESNLNSLYDMPTAVETVLYDVATQMLQQRGLPDTSQNRTAMRVEIQTGGYNIYSTIDPEVQRIAEDVVYNWDSYPKMQDSKNETVRRIASNGVITETVQPQAAVSIMDYANGEYLAVVGSRTPPTGYLEFNRARDSLMPVGSSIKPIAVYGPALDKGYSPASVQLNLPVPIDGWDSARGYPANSTRGNYMGIVTLRQGMRASLNIVAARTLMDYVGLSDSQSYLTSMGVDPSHIDNTPFGLSLGSSRLSTMEMSAAFGTIANKGVYQTPISFTRVTDSQGNEIINMKQIQQQSQMQVFRAGTAWMLTDMLVDAVRSGTGSPAKISGMTVGGKTGTNSDYAGVSFSGITPYYACSVWIGHDENHPLYSGATGGKEAAPMWKEIMSRVHEEKELEDKAIIEDAPEDLGLTKATVCSASGLLPTDACALDTNFKPVTDWFHSDSLPTQTCNMHVDFPLCADTGMYSTEYCPNTTANVALLLPEGHAAEQLSAEQLRTLLPGAILAALPNSVEELDGTITQPPVTLESLRQNPRVATGLCTIHQSAQPENPNGGNGSGLGWGDSGIVGGTGDGGDGVG